MPRARRFCGAQAVDTRFATRFGDEGAREGSGVFDQPLTLFISLTRAF